MNKEEIKKILSNFPTLYALVKVINNRHRNEFISFINGYNENPEIVIAHPKKKETYTGKPICKIVAGTREDGFFACVRWALDGLYFCDSFGYLPIVEFPNESIYKDISVFADEVNPFEYFFEKTDGDITNALDEYPRVEYCTRNYFWAENLNGGISYKVSQNYIDKMAIIMSKYLSFKKNVLEHVQKTNSTLCLNERTLAVHVRGTDYRKNYRNHPVFLETKDYYNAIDSVLNKGKFDRIFLATDDKDILSEFLGHYRDMVVFSESSERGTGTDGVHTSNCIRKSPYYLALDVISDMIALSSCGGIISGMSQVSLLARIYRKSINKDYLYDEILDKGINKKGAYFKIK